MKESNYQIIKLSNQSTTHSHLRSKQVGSSLQHHGRQPADSRRNLPESHQLQFRYRRTDSYDSYLVKCGVNLFNVFLSTYEFYLICWYPWFDSYLMEIWYVDTSYYLRNACLLVSWYVPLCQSKVKECAKKEVPFAHLHHPSKLLQLKKRCRRWAATTALRFHCFSTSQKVEFRYVSFLNFLILSALFMFFLREKTKSSSSIGADQNHMAATTFPTHRCQNSESSPSTPKIRIAATSLGLSRCNNWPHGNTDWTDWTYQALV